MSFEPRFIFLDAEPDKDRSSYDMIFGHESPVAAVGAIVAVVTLHPVVVHCELILLANYHWFELIRLRDATIDRIILRRDEYLIALARNINRSVVIACP